MHITIDLVKESYVLSAIVVAQGLSSPNVAPDIKDVFYKYKVYIGNDPDYLKNTLCKDATHGTSIPGEIMEVWCN